MHVHVERGHTYALVRPTGSFFGGVGQMRGTVLGALLLGLLTNLLLFTGISTFYQMILQGVVLVVAVAVKTLATRERVA